jgi:hypothetical protein
MAESIIKKPIPNKIVAILGRSIIDVARDKNIQMSIPELSIIYDSIYDSRSIFGVTLTLLQTKRSQV